MMSRAIWEVLKAAHKDHVSGGRISWLQKPIITQMDPSEDVLEHIFKITRTYEKLDALITSNTPLRPDNIFSISVLVLLLSNWLRSVSHIFQHSTVTSLEREAVSHSNQTGNKPIYVSQENTNAIESCSYCGKSYHSLASCWIANQILQHANDD